MICKHFVFAYPWNLHFYKILDMLKKGRLLPCKSASRFFGYSYSLAILILPRGAHKSNMIFGKSVKFIKDCIFLYAKNGTSREGVPFFYR